MTYLMRVVLVRSRISAIHCCAVVIRLAWLSASMEGLVGTKLQVRYANNIRIKIQMVNQSYILLFE